MNDKKNIPFDSFGVRKPFPGERKTSYESKRRPIDPDKVNSVLRKMNYTKKWPFEGIARFKTNDPGEVAFSDRHKFSRGKAMIPRLMGKYTITDKHGLEGDIDWPYYKWLDKNQYHKGKPIKVANEIDKAYKHYVVSNRQWDTPEGRLWTDLKRKVATSSPTDKNFIKSLNTGLKYAHPNGRYFQNFFADVDDESDIKYDMKLKDGVKTHQ